MGGDIINHISFFILILLYSLFFTFHSYPQDITNDEISKEAQYFNKVKSAMDKDDEDREKRVVESEDDKQKKADISIGYFPYLKIIIVLVLVILVIYGISLILRRFLRIKGDIGGGANIIINQSLGPGKWLQVVYIGGKYLVLGVTNDQINLITEIEEPKEIERLEIILNEKKVNEGESFIDVVSDFFKNKLKKKINKEKFNYETDAIDFFKKQKERINKMNNE